MSRRLVLSSLAELDMLEAWVFMARESIPAADRKIDRLKEAFHLLCAQAEIGEAIDSAKPPSRMFTVESFVIFYRPTQDELFVLRVLHGSRDEVDRMRRRNS